MIQLILPIGFLLVIDLYFFQIIRTLISGQPDHIKIGISVSYWILNVMIFAGLVASADRSLMNNHTRYYIFSLMMVFFIPKLVGSLFLLAEDVYRLITGVLGLFGEQDSTFLSNRRSFISTAGIIAAGIPFATMLYGMVKTGFSISVKQKKVQFDDLPKAFDGVKIAQISDLHSGSFGSNSFFEAAVDKILEQKPDIILVTGDLVNNEAAEAERFVSTFSKLKAPLGVYSVLGNHDYGDYGPWPSSEAKAENLKRLKKIHSDSNWNLLCNENHIIHKDGEQLAVIGVENWGASRHFPKKGDLDKAVLGVENIPFKLLLSHDPSHWDAKIKDHSQKFQLTFSGHTHGAQFGIEIPGFRWSPAQYIYKQWAGLYQESDGQKLYVNRGLGFIGYMGRIGIPPEITILELQSKENV